MMHEVQAFGHLLNPWTHTFNFQVVINCELSNLKIVQIILFAYMLRE